MELIARIVIRRYDMGETAGEGSIKQVPSKSLAVFRVIGKSLDRAMKLLASEMEKEDGQVVVLTLAGTAQTQAQQSTFEAAYSKGRSQGVKLVICGGDPGLLVDRLAVYRDSLRWFPNLPAYVSSLELNNRH